MKKNIFYFALTVLVFIAFVCFFPGGRISTSTASAAEQADGPTVTAVVQYAGKTPQKGKKARSFSARSAADSLIGYAKRFLGTPYFYTGKTAETGFDCSGFTSYIYQHFHINVVPGSTNQAEAGYRIPVEEAKKGDLLIFTGTNLSVREPGHVGIVISEKGQPLSFIHSSSNGGVKISEVPTTRYADRLLEVRRVL